MARSKDELETHLANIRAAYVVEMGGELSDEELIKYLDEATGAKRKKFLDKRLSYFVECDLEGIRKVVASSAGDAGGDKAREAFARETPRVSSKPGKHKVAEGTNA